ncbi:MAG: DNA-methyltransferase [Bacillota bacterium]
MSDGTFTKQFGSSERENHDSTSFYTRNLYNNKDLRHKNKIEYKENEIPKENIDKFFCKSSESMDELPDKSVHLMVTSPPYNVGKEYDEDYSLEQYLKLLKNVFKETYRVLVPGGRVCINIANLGRKPYIPLHSYIIDIMNSLDYFMRGEIIWKKNMGSGGCAWGSWKSASNPVLRDQHEYILVFSKQTMGRPNPYDREDTIKKEEFLKFTQSIWKMSPESANKVGHPAPFPVELPYRCIQLYTFKNEVVLDPFAGVGSTALGAKKSNRNFVGYEIKEDYIKKAKKRVKNYQKQLELKFE